MIITRVVDFPDHKAKALCILDADGDYNIYLNGKLSSDAQAEGYLHELQHIFRGDYEQCDVQSIEAQAHNI